MSDDQEIDDILAPGRKKGIKSGQKGKRAEREIVHALNERFKTLLEKNPDWGEFSRSVGSGNRWGQNVKLSKSSQHTYSGDITCPDSFKFVLESKCGYNDIDLCACYAGVNKPLDAFLKQAVDESSRCGRLSMLLWKKDRKPTLAFLKDCAEHQCVRNKIPGPNSGAITMLLYNGWFAVPFDWLLTFDDSFFFNGMNS